MIVNAETRPTVAAAFWKGLALFWKRHSMLLSHIIERVTLERLGTGRQIALELGAD